MTDLLDERRRAEAMFRAQAEHRLKTSLALISGWAATLDDAWDDLPDARRREGVAVLRRASDDLSEQTCRLLQQTRAELLALDLQPVVLDLAGMLDVAAHALDGSYDGYRVVHATSGRPVLVRVDPTALHEVLAHLVDNAVKYSPAGATVTLCAAVDADAGGVVLAVIDEGVGIPEDVDLFAPFQRGGSAAPGVGLGLYVVRNLVEAMGGEVSAARNATGGSIFTVRLPLG